MSGHILITRHPSDCHELQSLLDPCGLKLRPYPVLRLSDVHDEEAWKDLLERFPGGAAPAWLVLASPRAPERFAAECRQRGVEWLIGLPTAAIGTGTADAARNAGLRLEVVGPGSGSGLAQQLIRELSERTTMIFACGRDRRPELQHILGEAGHQVLPIVVYKMDATPPRELPPLGPSLDGVVLTSPRAARLYLESVGGLPLPCQHWALGATTRDAAAAIGIDCRTPREPTIQSLAEELCKN